MAFYKFTNHIFRRIMSKAVFVLLAMIIIESATFYTSAKNTNFNLFRYEQVLEKANINIIFIIFFVLALVCIFVSVFELTFGSKSIYSIMQLPLSKTHIFYSFLISGISCVFIFVSVQMTLGLVFGQWLPTFFPKAVSTIQGFEYMQGYTSLSFIRFESLSWFFPLSIESGFRSLVLLIAPVITLIYTVVFIISKKHLALLLLLPLLFFLFIPSADTLANPFVNFILSGITAGISIGMAVLAIRNLKAGDLA